METFHCTGCDYSGDQDQAISHCEATGHTLTSDPDKTRYN